jgi:hypothetical protein
MDDFNKIEQEILEKAQRVDWITLLFVDLSSSCTGFASAEVNFHTKTAKFTSAGSLWIPKIEQEHKCSYMYNAFVNYFNIVTRTDFVVMEKYSINPKKMMGVLVTPELHGAVKAALSEAGIKFSYVYPQSWHSGLDIKKDKANKDWKGPTKQKVLEYVQVPEKVTNNLTHKERNTSSDIYDSIAIGIYFLQKLNIKNLDFSNITWQPHVGVLSEVENM